MKKHILILSSLILTLGLQAADLRLWYNRPAENWNEALPLGNGRLAAMIYGVPAIEHLQLNEESVWAGGPNNNANPDALKAIPEISKLIFEGKYKEAEDMANDKVMAKTNSGMPYQSVGDLYINFPGHLNYTDYIRDLDISKAVASVSYTVNGVRYHRESFVSFTDQVMIVRFTADRPGSISCNIMLDPAQEKYDWSMSDNSIIMTGKTDAHEKNSGKVKYQTRIKALNDGGSLLAKNNIISVEKANTLTLYISIATNFKNYKELTEDEQAKCLAYMNKAFGRDYDKVKSEHIAFYQKQFNRVSLNLGETDAVSKPIDERIRDFAKVNDPQLAALYFQFGRYLLISSSQPGCQPANLQGKWCNQLLPAWDSKYTTNINAEMNYWPAEVTNLSELQDPFFQMVREVAESGKETAKIMYGARGWVLHHNTDIWRITGAVDRATSGMWSTGGAWLSNHLWERYRYTGDRKFLQAAYPIMKGAAQFFLDVMVEEPKHHWLVLTPATSPENVPAGHNSNITAGCTMDNQLIFDLFTNLKEAEAILKVDKAFGDTLQTALSKMAPMQIGRFGQLQEWMNDWDDPHDIHRHVSHLWGLFPGNQISPYRSPELFDAARTSLIHRGDPSTGWSMAWKICYWSRLLDGDHAYKLLQNQLDLVTADQKKKGGTYANLFDAHPPFQIDGNFGCTAGITEMLMQSHDGFVFILPALPSVWKNGEIKGIIARGGFELSYFWENGALKKLTVLSKAGGNLRLRVLTPIKGKGLKAAKGENPNPIFAVQTIKKPLISEKAKLNPVNLKKTYLYDVATLPGQTLVFEAIK
ncbi:glycosyl hydrolase family 95 catalytic domain-containing protein [Parabacteroides sp. FAFU027]|uniref:glycoside hydrolase family 95 protein n=1 Tax=Parabacteroides sp. FAFU027 TaxID=2922715 RepID=UPI001FAF7C62|nr:glycoside hydrolase family 95 protein [Parabacteroides sp. FAFU027]